MKKFELLSSIILILSFALSISFAAQLPKSVLTHDNGNLKNTETDYHPNVVGLSDSGTIRGVEAMKTFMDEIRTSYGEILNDQSHFQIAVNKNWQYEIGSFDTEKGIKFARMTVWVREDDHEQAVLEVVYKISESQNPKEQIESARDKWMNLCNGHEVKKLVGELYTEDAHYFNRGRLLKGHTELISEYAYMGNSSYSLQLHPKHIEVVNENIVFEIGQCSGSYPLPYLLVWNKESNGEWKILLDSNY